MSLICFSCSYNSSLDNVEIRILSVGDKGKHSRGLLRVKKGGFITLIENGSFGNPGDVKLIELNNKKYVFLESYTLNKGIAEVTYDVFSTENKMFGLKVAQTTILNYYEHEKKERDEYVNYIISKEVKPTFDKTIKFDIRSYVIKNEESNGKRDTLFSFSEVKYLKID